MTLMMILIRLTSLEMMMITKKCHQQKKAVSRGGTAFFID